uniref:N-acetylglucosaminyldiphosphodolichol N-acetylglucosaminyltransferase n=1 Tax=Bubo bubo TaxID=30461 RepID=A0A8C0E6C8_BUBBB
MAPSRKGGTYQKITGGYFSGIEMDVKTRKRMLKKFRGKEVFMTVAYSRGQPVLPPRLQHSVPSGRSPPVHCSQGGGNVAPYESYHSQNPPQRHNRGFGMPRGSARFINRHNMVGPQIAFCPSPGKRCYQNYDNFSFSRSRRQMQCVNKECQYGFVPGNGEEPQEPEETLTFYEIEGEDDAAFPTLPVTTFTARTSKMHLCEVRIVELCDVSIVFVKASCRGSLLNTLTLFQVMVNSAAISTSTGVYAAPATGFSSNSAVSTPASVTTAVPPQTAVQPVIVSPLSIGRPGRVYILWLWTWMSEDGEYVVVHMTLCFFLFSKYYHQSYWPSMVYVQPVLPPSPVEVYPAYAEPAPVLDQSVPQLYTDAGRTEVHQVPLETPANGNFQNVEPPPLSYGPVYYPVVSDPFSQQSLPGFDSLVPAYRYISTWHPVNPPYGNSPQIANAVSSGPLHQVSYIASPNPAPHDMPQGM